MAVRVETEAFTSFGELTEEATVSHVTAEDATSGEVISEKALAAPRTLAANQQAQFPAKELDFLFKKGADVQGYQDAGLQKIYEAYFETKPVRIRLKNKVGQAAPVEITAAGYKAATIAAGTWVYSTEAD